MFSKQAFYQQHGIDWDAEARRMIPWAESARLQPPSFNGTTDKLQEYLPPNAEVLDCGCNIGQYSKGVVAAGFRYVGVDQSAFAIQEAKRLWPEQEFWHCNLVNLPLDRTFDAAISQAVLQHISLADKRLIWPRVYQVVKPGGIYLVAESTLEEGKSNEGQLSHSEWIREIGSFGFTLIETLGKNDLGLNDIYIFRR